MTIHKAQHTPSGDLKRLQLSLALLRVLAGGYFGWMAWQKWHDPVFIPRLESWLRFWAVGNPIFIYQDILNGIVIPHVGLFGPFVMGLEVLIAASYVLGVMVPVLALVQLFLTANYLLAFGHSGTEPLTINALFMVFGVLFYWNDAGQYYGLDYWIPWRLAFQNGRLAMVRV